MIKAQAKNLVIFFIIIGFIFNMNAPGIAQTNPSWSNEEPGHIEPPNGGVFIHPDPLPVDMQDITIFTSDKNGIKLKVTFPDAFDYECDENAKPENYRRYKASSAFKVIGNVGEPELLHRVFWLQVPADADNIKIANAQQSLKGNAQENVSLYPIPEIIFEEISKGIESSQEVFTINENIYGKDRVIPQEPACIIEEAFKHGLRLIKVAIPVMTYNPKARVIQELKEIQLTITYESELENNAIAIDSKNSIFHQIFKSTIPNYAYRTIEPQIGTNLGGIVEIRGDALTNASWAEQNNYFPDYLVIASEAFHENDTISESLLAWATHRTRTLGGNHDIAIAYVNEIVSAYPEPVLKEEKIKAFIEMVYEEWRISEKVPELDFLLLVGDADQGGEAANWFLPVWRTAEERTTSDNDYSWLEGDDEEADVLMGRFPSKNEEELFTMVKKITDLETTMPQGNNHYGTRSLFLYAGGGIKAPNAVISEAKAITNFLVSKKQEIVEFHNYYLSGLSPFKFTSNTITDFLSTEGALFLSYAGHGGVQEFWPDTVNVWNISNPGTMPAVLIAQSCQTAHFDLADGNSYGEQWIKHEDSGTISYFGSLRNVGGGFIHGKNFAEAVFNNNLTILGGALDIVRQSFIFDEKKVYSLLGDPALNFTSQMGQSTKPDISIDFFSRTPLFPSSFNEPIKISSFLRNNSDQMMSNIPIKLLSVESGNFDNILNESVVPSLEPNAAAVDDFILNYQGESSRLFLPWADPDNTIEELSEFNNWHKHISVYFPIYVDAENTSGIEHGTLEKPFTHLKHAIEYANTQDYIGDDYRQELYKAIEVRVAPGRYGNGSIIESKSLVLRGLSGAKDTIIHDSLDVTGAYLQVQDVTFDGKKGTTCPAVTSRPNENGSNERKYHINYFFRNVFKKWANDYAVRLKRVEANSKQSSYYFYNNIFERNFGTVQMMNAPWRKNFLNMYNNTFANNLHNLSINFAFDANKIQFNFCNNIAWNNGSTNIHGKLTEYTVKYNNIDDPLFWELGWASTENQNFQIDPSFKDPARSDFTLNVDSESIDTGDPNPDYNDPDGSRNDQGAYGGPRAILRPLSISKPIHQSTLYKKPDKPYTLNIFWNTPYIHQPSEDIVHITLYHFEYFPAAPDRGSPGVTHYEAQKIIDIEQDIENLGSFIHMLSEDSGNKNYYLDIRMNDDLEKGELIYFKIMDQEVSLRNNR